MPLDLSRRNFIRGVGATLIAAPALVRASSLMQIRGVLLDEPFWYSGFDMFYNDGRLTAVTRKAFLPPGLYVVEQPSQAHRHVGGAASTIIALTSLVFMEEAHDTAFPMPKEPT